MYVCTYVCRWADPYDGIVAAVEARHLKLRRVRTVAYICMIGDDALT
jgi:hypothetical protein